MAEKTRYSDAELEEFVSFAQSPEGQAYYQAAFKTLQASLRNPQ